MAGLVSKRFIGDPLCEACLAGTHRFLEGDEGEAVLKIQLSLLELNYSLPQFGPDARYGPETAQEVSKFKTGRSIFPNDGIVGPKTIAALDQAVRANIIPNLLGVSDKADVARIVKHWLERLKYFVAGIDDTMISPFSAVCQLKITLESGSTGEGTGFLIAPDRILTAGHNLMFRGIKAKSIDVSPGQTSDRDTFGSVTVNDPTCFVRWPQFDPVLLPSKHDFGVIKLQEALPIPAGFELDELLFSPNTGIAICGYAGETVEVDRQHMDIDTIVSVNDGVLTYSIQSQRGNSGSPIFYSDGSLFVAVGVHTAANDAATNSGCQLTHEKIDWIRSV